jgi:hypothetical protein
MLAAHVPLPLPNPASPALFTSAGGRVRRRIGRGHRSMRSQSALPLSCPEADRSLQDERRARAIRWVSSMSARGEINFYSESR